MKRNEKKESTKKKRERMKERINEE